MKTQILLASTLALTCFSSSAATKIAGSLSFVSPTTGKAITSARVGRDVKVKIAVRDLNLIANKNVTFTYLLSVLPKGSNTPTTISGKLSGKFTKPASSGGATQTSAESADWVGLHSDAGLLTIPDFMPVGVATVTITLAAGDAGAIVLNKSINITL